MPSTVLVTTTLYQSPDELRFKLALKTCAAAKAAEYQLIVADGSPNEHIRDLLRAQGATVFKRKESAMGASRREVLKAGLDTGANVIVWLEPEKYPLVPLLGTCIGMVRAGIDIVVPDRVSLDSYPPYQELSELRANRELGRITYRPDLDLMFGPRVMSRVGAGLLCDYIGKPGEDNWEILFVPVLQALKMCLPVCSVQVPYVHPPEQTAAEQGDAAMNAKRDQQRRDLVDGMRRAAKELRHTR